MDRSKSSYRIWEPVADELEDEFLQAVYQGNTSIAESCIERGIDPNITDDEDLTPLHHSAIRGDVSMGQMLLSASATEKDKRNPDEGCTALMYACIYGNEQFVKLLLENGVNPNLINNKLETALHLACVQNSLNISRHLISNGANLDVRDAFDNSPLSIAAIERGSIPLTALLLKKGAQAAGVKEFPLILECVLNCNTMKRLKIIKMLLYYGTDILCKHPISKSNCLHYVALTGYFPAAKVLVKRAEENLYGTDLFGRTPVTVALEHRNLEIYRYYTRWIEHKELAEEFEDDIIRHIHKIFDAD